MTGIQVTQGITATSGRMLSDVERDAIRHMLTVWGRRRRGNIEKLRYYDQKNLFKDLRISTPPQLANFEAVLGWPAKTVDVLADRIQFERFTSTDQPDNPFGLDDVVADNDFRNEFNMAVQSALVQSCSFVAVSQGLDGEPDTLWMTRSAEQATGIWDRRRRGLAAGLTVDTDDDGKIERAVAYLPDLTADLVPDGRGGFSVTRVHNPTGRVMLEVLRYKPDLRRPFGRSRITPAIRYYSDAGVRTVVRSEIGAEFFTAPQRYGLGIDEDAFKIDRWTAVIGRFLTIGRDAEGELPQVGQFAQQSMQPHTDQLRMWAALVAGESSIPIDELGFVSDNPASDAAIQSQRDPLRLTADRAITYFGAALRGLAISTVALRERRDVSDVRGVRPLFAPTFRQADSAAADAAMKQASVIPWIAESPVFLEKLNYSQDEIDRLLADKKRAQGGSLLDRVLAARTSSGGGLSDEAE